MWHRNRVEMRKALLVSAVVVFGLWVFANRDRLTPRPMAQGTVSSEEAIAPESGSLEIPPPVKPAALPPEELVEIELIQAPASRYASAEMSESDMVYRRLIQQLDRSAVVYDANLGHAARELAYQHSIFGGLVPRPVLEFLLRSGGAIDRTVVQAYTATSGDDLEVVRERLEQIIDDRRDVVRRIGVGEAYIPGAKQSRHIAILVSERSLQVNPAPRMALPGSQWLLSGTLPEQWEKASGLVLYPDGRMVSIQPRTEGRRFSLEVPVGETLGEIEVSLSATGPNGPSPLVQLPVTVGDALPRRMMAQTPPDETHVRGARAAEALAYRLLNEDRAKYGLKPLIRHELGDEVARAHSIDMRDSGVFGHWSENTGSPGDRMAAAELMAVTHAENVAFGGSIHGAQEGLMHSLGHKKNILNSRYSHVGIGVAGKVEGRSTRWHLTQLFFVPASPLNRTLSERDFLTRVDSSRRAEGRRALARDPGLDRAAELVARVAAAGGTDDLAKRLIRLAKDTGRFAGGGFASVRVLSDPSSLSIPEEALHAECSRVGLAMVQLPDHPNGLVGVAMLFAFGDGS